MWGNLDIRVRILIVFGIILSLPFFNHLNTFLVLLGLAFILFFISGINIKNFFRSFTYIVPFLLIPLLLVPFYNSGYTGAFIIILKFLVSYMLLYILIFNSSESEILYGLRKLGFPKIFIDVMSIFFRYMSHLKEKSRKKLIAQKSRLFELRSILKRKDSYGLSAVITSLLMDSFNRTERIYIAMLSRGYSGELYYRDFKKLNGRDVSALFIFVIFLVFLFVLDRRGFII